MNRAVIFRDDLRDPTLPTHQIMDTGSFILRECLKTAALYAGRPVDDDLPDRRLDERKTAIDCSAGGVGDANT